MLSGLFGKKQQAPAGEFVTARLNARMQAMDRGEVYEDPLDDKLKAGSLGEVTGGGTQLADEGGIAFCDIEISLREVTDEVLEELKAQLEALGAPKGSKLIVESDGREIPFGANEGLAVHLNGSDLPDEVYANSDVNHVISEFNRLLGANGAMQSYWEGETETSLFLYGPSHDTMLACIQEFLDTYPLCQRARLEQIV